MTKPASRISHIGVTVTRCTLAAIMCAPVMSHATNPPRATATEHRTAHPATRKCSLQSGKQGMVLSGKGVVLENMRIDWIAESQAPDTQGPRQMAALTIRNATNITLKNLHIRHAGGRGLAILNSNGVRVENVLIESTDAPASGPFIGAVHENIFVYRSPGIRIDRGRLYRGSSGVYLIESNDSVLSNLYGEDFRGPYPRGQFVQWNRSDNGTLRDFFTVSSGTSWPEDNINIYRSKGALIQRGVIDGNNAPNGAGVIFDGGSSTGRVEDVDTIRMGNGSFSAYDGTNEVSFIRTRSKNHICADQGRGKPSSGGTIWTAHPRLNSVRVIDSTFSDACFQVAWPRTAFSRLEVQKAEFTTREQVKPIMCWEKI